MRVAVFIMELVEAVGKINRLVVTWFVFWFNEGVDMLAFEVANAMASLYEGNSWTGPTSEDVDLYIEVIRSVEGDACSNCATVDNYIELGPAFVDVLEVF